MKYCTVFLNQTSLNILKYVYKKGIDWYLNGHNKSRQVNLTCKVPNVS